MTNKNTRGLLVLATVALLGGCATATRPVNPPITEISPNTGYRFEVRQAQQLNAKENLVILAFSGGGTRAAAFSFGVLEFLRRTEVIGPKGNKGNLLDSVDVITGVSGGSFTALAYGLYGDKLFAEYEQRFLKRDVQGEIVSRSFSPSYWGKLNTTGWGRSELAAELYDEILFNGATFGDLNRGKGPLILASATDISTGSRFVFSQGVFDIICSDLNGVRLSRAASASSAVPVVLSPVTMNNYGGTCKRTLPAWEKLFIDKEFIGAVIGPQGKVIQEIQKETGATINIEEVGNYGEVSIFSPAKEGLDRAVNWIKGITAVPSVGETYEAKVKTIQPYGAFVEFLPKKEGLLHISEVSWKRLDSLEGILKEGDVVKVKLIGIDHKTGKFKLSRKVLMPNPGGQQQRAPQVEGGEQKA